MQADLTPDIRQQWEEAAGGWARWEPAIAAWMEPATETMLGLAGIAPGFRVLDLACGAGSQTLEAARRVGPRGRVVANDLAEPMLEHVRQRARAAGLDNITTLAGPAEKLELATGDFDACTCRLGLMLFADPAGALRAAWRALRPGGRIAVVVFTTPASNPFMAEPMRILLRHTGKAPPGPDKPGIFALGAPGVLERLLSDAGFAAIEARTVPTPMRMESATQTLRMMQEAFGAYRAVLADSPADVRAAAWSDVLRLLRTFETDEGGFVAPTEVLVAGGTRAA